MYYNYVQKISGIIVLSNNYNNQNKHIMDY